MKIRKSSSVHLELLARLFIFFGVVAALGSSVFLSGWSGASDQGNLIKLIAIFLTVSYFLTKCLHSSLRRIEEIYLFFPIFFCLLLTIPQKNFNFTTGLISYIAICSVGFLTIMFLQKSYKLAFLLSLPVGQLILVIFLHISSSAGILNVGAKIFLIVGVIAAAFIGSKIVGKRVLTPLEFHFASLDPLFSSCLFVLMLIYGISATTPVLGFDALNMKLWLPFQWNYNDSIVLLTNHIHSGIIGGFSYSSFLGMPFGQLEIGSTLQFLSISHFMAAVLLFGRKWFAFENIHISKFYFFTLFALPYTLWQMCNAYDDVWAMCIVGFVTLYMYEMKNNINLYVSALVTASLAITKLSLVTISAAVVLVTFLQISNLRIALLSKLLLIIKYACTFLAAICVPIGWKWLNYENPFWPLYNSVFKASTLPVSNEKFNMPFAKADWVEIFLAPFSSIINPGTWTEEIAPGVYGASLAIILLATFLSLRKDPRNNRFNQIALTLFVISWVVELQYLRYVVYVLPIAVIVFLDTLSEIPKSISTKRKERISRYVANFVLISAVFSLPIGNPVSPDRIPFKVAFGLENESDYRKRSMPIAEAIDWINSNSERNSVVLGINVFQRLWFRPDIDILQWWEYKNGKAPNYLILSDGEDISQVPQIDRDCYELVFAGNGWSVLRLDDISRGCDLG